MIFSNNFCVLLFCGMLLCTDQLWAQTQASGYVYEDRNGNGKKEKRELGLVKVPVSNGRDVVLTDQNGRFRLSVDDDDILFVIKPAGYKLPVNKQNLPQFYYRHKPFGSPKLKYPGTAPTGDLPASVDFGLTRQTESDDFRVLVFGDPQVYNMNQVDYFQRGIIDELKGKTNDFSFGISLGDLVGDNLSLHKAYNAAIAQLNVPWHNVMGNHDVNYDVKADSLSDEGYEAEYGPSTYSFNYGKVHFIILDDILYPHPLYGKGYWGGMRTEQLDFIENDLKLVPKDHLIVLNHHIHLFGDFRPEDKQRLFDLLKEFPHTLSLSAHTHMQQQYFHDQKDGLNRATPHHEYNVGTTSGDWYTGELNDAGIPSGQMRDGTPKGYMFVSFSGSKYQMDYRVAGAPKDYKIGIYAPRAIPKGRLPWNYLYANFFQGCDRDTLEYRIDDGPWKPMKWTADLDPIMCGIRYRWDTADNPLKGVKPTSPAMSPHLWKVALSGNVDEGRHIIEVRAKDTLGRVYTNSTSFMVTETDMQ